MKIASERHDDLTRVLRLEGDLDADGSAELDERCGYEQQEGGLHFVIDLGGVAKVGGSGLRVLLGLARTLAPMGGSLVLHGLDRGVEEALQVSGLRGVFELAPDRAAALQRSQQIQAGRGAARDEAQREAQEKIDLAIALLGPSPRRK
jgi:anti-anti-sigma factor